MGWQGGEPALLIHVAVQKTRDYFWNIICIVTTQAGNKKWAPGIAWSCGARSAQLQNKAGPEKKRSFFAKTRVSHTIACLQIPASDLNSHPSPGPSLKACPVSLE